VRGPYARLLIALLLGACIVYGAANGSRWVRFQGETIDAAVEEERERLAGIRNDIPKLDTGEKKVTLRSRTHACRNPSGAPLV
jgi:hypothetical protein